MRVLISFISWAYNPSLELMLQPLMIRRGSVAPVQPVMNPYAYDQPVMRAVRSSPPASHDFDLPAGLT